MNLASVRLNKVTYPTLLLAIMIYIGVGGAFGTADSFDYACFGKLTQ